MDSEVEFKPLPFEDALSPSEANLKDKFIREVGQTNPSGKSHKKGTDETGSAGPPEIKRSQIVYDEEKDLIGYGAFGYVYRGVLAGKAVAFKVPKNQNLSSKQLKAFRDEVRIMRAIYHPNVTLFLGACVAKGDIVIVTELLQTDVETYIDKNPNLSLYDRLKIAKDAALGMNWLHSICSIVHRDLKPANLLMDEHKTVKVADFGFGEYRPKFDKEQTEKFPKGTAIYMAPELLLSEPFNEKIDVYMLPDCQGEVLFPEFSDEIEEFIDAIYFQQQRPPLPQSVTGTPTPASLKYLLTKSWAHNKDDRPSFKEVVFRLDEILIDTVIQHPEAREFWKKHFLIPSQALTERVSTGQFASALKREAHAKMKSKSISKALQAIFPRNKKTISTENFNQLLEWFGPIHKERRLLSTVVKLANHIIERDGWFHGFLERHEAEGRVKDREENIFLVRLSDFKGHPFTITKIKDRKIVHKRIECITTGKKRKLCVPVGNSKQTFDNIILLIDKLIELNNLGQPCPHELGSDGYTFGELA